MTMMNWILDIYLVYCLIRYPNSRHTCLYEFNSSCLNTVQSVKRIKISDLLQWLSTSIFSICLAN